MSGRAPGSFWDRLMRRLGGTEDEERQADESSISFHLLFIVPVLLVLAMLMRR